MDLHEYLGLDHFLFIFQTAFFQKLKKLSSIFKNVDHKTMEGSDYRYEQVVLMARDGTYFECINGEDSNNLGLALSSSNPGKIDVDVLLELYPNLDWAIREIKTPDNTPWFTYYMVSQTDLDDPELYFQCWAMQYQDMTRHRVYKYQTKPPIAEFTIDELVSATVKVPPEYLKSVKYQFQWLPGHKQIFADRAVLKISNASGKFFMLVLLVDKEVVGITPTDITFKLVENEMIEVPELEGINILGNQNTIKLDFLII